MTIDPNIIREKFPIFSAHKEFPLAYLDTAASSQKPLSVIKRLSDFLSFEHSNINRGAYSLSAKATEHFQEAREKVANFIGAEQGSSILFTRGTTEAINLVSRSLEHHFTANDSIVITVLEHHSNIVPWQMLSKRTGAKLYFADINDDATVNTADLYEKISKYRPKIVAITQLSNIFGTVVPIAEIVKFAHQHGAMVLVDGAQSVPHGDVNVQELDLDFLAFSGHKFYGPTGIGVLYVRPDRYNMMEPFQGGGDMISTVTVEGSTWAEPPRKFEAGTPAIAEAIALGEAVDFVVSIGAKNIKQHEDQIFNYAWKILSAEDGVSLYGPRTTAKPQASIISFTVDRVHPHDLATIADEFNVQFRGGHHCAMPALKRMGLQATARISFGVYSREQDIDALLEAIQHAKKVLW